jgi:hypothetical protein
VKGIEILISLDFNLSDKRAIIGRNVLKNLKIGNSNNGKMVEN